MSTADWQTKIYEIFAESLTYPTVGLKKQFDDLLQIPVLSDKETTRGLTEFQTFLSQTRHEKVEELYTATFELQTVCCPYIGYLLFGENHMRGMFMAKLEEHYRSHDYSRGSELPDHLSVMLGFLARHRNEGDNRELEELCMVPALEKMVNSFRGDSNPYQKLLLGLLHSLKAEQSCRASEQHHE